MTQMPPAGWSSSLRRESCPLAGAITHWLQFSAAMPTAFLGLAILAGLAFTAMTAVRFFFLPGVFLFAPEWMTWIVVDEYPGIVPGMDRTTKFALVAAVFVLRLSLVSAWGIFRLRRQKRAPYAETLWLFAACVLASRWIMTDFDESAILLYSGVLLYTAEMPVFLYFAAGILALAGLVVFAIQRCWPPSPRISTL